MNCNIDEILDKAKTLIKDEMSELSFKTWIEPLRISSIDNNKIYLIATDSFKKDSVESRYKDLLINAFNMVLQRNCEIYIILNSEDKKVEAKNNLSTSNITFLALSTCLLESYNCLYVSSIDTFNTSTFS